MKILAGALIVVMTAACSSVALAADVLPLTRGFYVANVPCNKASLATISKYNGGDALMSGPLSCKLKLLNQTGQTYQVSQVCRSDHDNSTLNQTADFIVESATAYIIRNEFGTFKNRHCPTSALPRPWGPR